MAILPFVNSGTMNPDSPFCLHRTPLPAIITTSFIPLALAYLSLKEMQLTLCKLLWLGAPVHLSETWGARHQAKEEKYSPRPPVNA